MSDSTSLPPRDKIKDMKGGDLFALIMETLEDEASYIRTMQEIHANSRLVSLNELLPRPVFMSRAARKHHVFTAIAEIFDLLLKEAEAAKTKGQIIDPMIGRIAATIKKSLLREMDALAPRDDE
jgi:hypothetical protein